MVYLLNQNINQDKNISTALTEIYGIGKTLSKKICIKLGISFNMKVNRLNKVKLEKVSELINENFYFGNELKQILQKQQQRLVKISSYRGLRLKQGLPARGQRTHTNANTALLCRRKHI